MKKIKSYCLTVVSVSLLLLMGACTKSSLDTSMLYVPSYSEVTANATLQELEQGRELYINNCSVCHGLYSPDNYAPAQWETVLNNMAPRTSLTSSEVLLVTKYVSKGKQ
jgi:mono/diheme cytochrome c family protein